MIKLTNEGNVMIDETWYDEKDLLNLLRLQKQLLTERNLLATIEECEAIWSRYSSDLSASWLDFPNNNGHILTQIESSDFFTTYEDYAK